MPASASPPHCLVRSCRVSLTPPQQHGRVRGLSSPTSWTDCDRSATSTHSPSDGRDNDALNVSSSPYISISTYELPPVQHTRTLSTLPLPHLTRVGPLNALPPHDTAPHVHHHHLTASAPRAGALGRGECGGASVCCGGGLPCIPEGHLCRLLGSTLSLMETLEPSERDMWRSSPRALGAVRRQAESDGGKWGGLKSYGEALIDVADLAGCDDICCQGNRSHPYARDMLRRNF